MAECGGLRTAHPGTDVEEQYVLCGRMENGVLFTAKNSTAALLKNGARVYGSRGWAELPDYWKARRAVFHSREGGEDETVSYPCEHELIYEARHIAECREKGLLQSPVVTGEFSAQAIRVIEKLRADWSGK